jgi:hypothetical protein
MESHREVGDLGEALPERTAVGTSGFSDCQAWHVEAILMETYQGGQHDHMERYDCL